MTDALDRPASPVSRRGLAIAGALFVVAVVVQLASMSRVLGNVYDEGLIVYGAQRILEGGAPYRDFWTNYPPGQFYAVAGLFKLFGSTVLIERLWDVAIRAGVTTMVLLWTLRLGAGCYAYAAWAVVLVLLAGFGFHGYPVQHALLFALVSGYLALGALSAERPGRWLFAAGVSAGIAALFRHDIGFYAVASDALLLTWWAPRRLIATLPPLALGAGLIVGAAVILLLLTVPVRDLWFNLVVMPATIYPRTRALPFPGFPDPRALFDAAKLGPFNDGVDACFPLAVAAAALAYLAVTARNAQQPLRRAGILLLTLLTLALFLKGLVRTHNVHLVQSVIPAIALLAALLARMPRRIAAGATGAAAAIMLLALPARIALSGVGSNIETIRAVRNETGLRIGLPRLCAPQPGLERARCFLPRPPDDARIALLIQSLTRPGEPVYVGPSRHDRVFINNQMLQFLMARPSPTRWTDTHPGIQTSAPVQAEMIAEFTARNVRYLVLSAEWQDTHEPNESAKSSGVTLLDDYIRANFDEMEKFGAVSVWRRR